MPTVNVYLDSGDLANLERLAVQAPIAFDEFLSGWGERGCALALSLHHAQELSQLADSTSRARRLSVLERFPSVRFEPGGSHKVLTFEIMVQVIARLNQEAPEYAPKASACLFQDVGLDAFKATVLESREHLVALQAAQGATAKARDTTRGTRLPHSYRRQTRDKMDLPAALRGIQSALTAEGLTGEMRAHLESLRANLESCPNLRSAFERTYGIEGYDCVGETDDEDIHRVGTFFTVAREAISAYATDIGAPADRCLALLPTLDPYGCPGTRIEMAVSRAQDLSNQAAESSDEPDRAHVSFLPYVDVLFADRRTVAFFQQAVKGGRRNESLVSCAPKLHKSGPAEALLRSIDSATSPGSPTHR
jgi:hypothetical protein